MLWPSLVTALLALILSVALRCGNLQLYCVTIARRKSIYSHILFCFGQHVLHVMLLFRVSCIRDNLLRRSMFIVSLSLRQLEHYYGSRLLVHPM